MKSRVFRVSMLFFCLLGLFITSCQEEDPAPSAPIQAQPTLVVNSAVVEDPEEIAEPAVEEQVPEESDPEETPEEVPEGAEEEAAPTVEVEQETAVISPGSTVQHQVQAGDWLMQIARCYGADYTAVQKANPHLGNPNWIFPGNMVTVPNVGSNGEIGGSPCVAIYHVEIGDTWSGLATRFGTTAVILQRVNPGPLLAGDRIIVPANNSAANP